MSNATRVLTVLLVTAWTATTLAGEPEVNWAQFRGPRGDGSTATSDLALTWSETENVTWKTPIAHRGWSSPVIGGKQV